MIKRRLIQDTEFFMVKGIMYEFRVDYYSDKNPTWLWIVSIHTNQDLVNELIGTFSLSYRCNRKFILFCTG